ncbi:MAG TPA: GNAT family N-acetyltransferase [Candidatus Binatia bacterium]|nr:GNAT family N-acetyltransferase [Candidatus Binatia bacterium]
MAITVVQRKPSVEEFESVVASVGFRAHDKAAVEIALHNTIFSVCAMEEQYLVGLGRLVGDGAIGFLLTNIMVRPSHQRRGLGSLIVKALCSYVEALPYKNIVVEVVPLPGSASFYERFGFKASRSALPGMVRWFNDERASHS